MNIFSCLFSSSVVFLFLFFFFTILTQGDTDYEIFEGIKTSKINLDDKAWRRRTEKLKNFVKSLLCKDPEQRMTAADAMHHPWMLQHRKREMESGDGSSSGGSSGSSGSSAATTTTTTTEEKNDFDFSNLSMEEVKIKWIKVVERNRMLREELLKSERLEEELSKALETRRRSSSREGKSDVVQDLN